MSLYCKISVIFIYGNKFEIEYFYRIDYTSFIFLIKLQYVYDFKLNYFYEPFTLIAQFYV